MKFKADTPAEPFAPGMNLGWLASVDDESGKEFCCVNGDTKEQAEERAKFVADRLNHDQRMIELLEEIAGALGDIKREGLP